MRARWATVVLLLVIACACARARPRVAPLPPLRRDAEVHVYAQPRGYDADRLSFTVTGVSLLQANGEPVALQLATGDVEGGARTSEQRLLARGRVPPGDYAGLTVTVGAAGVGEGEDRSKLLVPPDPVRVDLRFELRAGASIVLWTALKPEESIRTEYGFTPAFIASIAPQTPPQVALYVTSAGGASVTAIDRGARLVTGVIPVGAEPRGVALDRAARRAYVALSRDDQLEVVDVAANRAIGRIRLTPGDGPRDVALTPGGTLLVVNERSRTLSFVDPDALAEVARVSVGDAPSWLRIDRSGGRAYVANRGSATITVVDVANRAVVGTLATDPEPLQLDLSRDGSRLYVVHRGSAYLGVVALPSLAQEPRAYVGLGATAIKVDPRSDLIYLSRGVEQRVVVYDPVSLQPLDEFDVPAAVTRMTIDDAENALLALMPGGPSIGVVDLTSRTVLAEIPVGPAPFAIALAGER